MTCVVISAYYRGMTDSELERFWSKVRKTAGGCWAWTDSLVTQGYGRLGLASGKAQYAHRLAYGHFIGPIGPDVRLENMCGSRSCVNPEHWQVIEAYELKAAEGGR